MTSTLDSSEEVEIARYIIIAATGAWVWDVFVTLAEDVRAYSKYKLQPPDIGHIISRFAAASFIFTSLAFSVSSTQHCHAVAKAVGWIGAITLPLHTIPFFFCARAVFFNRHAVIAIFGVLWIGTLGASVASPFFIHGTRIFDGSLRCAVSLDKPYSAGIVSVALHDLIVFISATTSLMSYTVEETWSAKMKAYFHRRGVSSLARFLMESGQSHIIPIVVFNVAAAVVNLIPSVPSSYKLAFVVMSVALQNAMTARIHRLIKTGVMSDHPTTTRVTSAVNPSVLEMPRGDDVAASWIRSPQAEAMELRQPVVVTIPGSPDRDGKAESRMSAEDDEKQCIP